MNKYRKQIAALIPTAETGEQWAEICRLEALAIAAETKRKSPEATYADFDALEDVVAAIDRQVA